jgi:hypothetical protein
MAVNLLIGAGGATIYAQATTPIYAVAEINVKDKDGYDKVLPKALDLIKNGGGKIRGRRLQQEQEHYRHASA